MSKHGRFIRCVNCPGQFPVNRENLRRRSRPGGFVCKRCERKLGKKEGAAK